MPFPVQPPASRRHVPRVWVFSCLALLLMAAPALAGQGAGNPATIMGVVTDETMALLPGVTVTATGPALQVPSVTTVTDAAGEYRLSPLPIGTYSVLFELSGFRSVRLDGIRLTVGFTARVDSALRVGDLAETVTVSGVSPLVDTTSTATSTELTREQLEVLPSSRDGFHAFLNQVPGARTNLDVGSSGLGDTVVFRAYGQEGMPWQMLEGVMGSSPTEAGSNGSHIDYNAIEGTRVQAVGSNAEMPRRGLFVDAVMKSGGNEFHGTAVAYGSSPALEGDNINSTLEGAGIRLPKLDRLYDVAATIGGRIVRNKLWFFAGIRDLGVNRQILDAFDPQGDPNGTPLLNEKRSKYHFEKLTYQPSPAHRFSGFFHYANDLEVRDASRFVPRESMIDKDNPVRMGKVEWQTVRGNALVASVQYGIWDLEGKNKPGAGKVSTIDLGTQFVTGDPWNTNGRLDDMGRHHTKGVVSYYAPQFLGGNHEFKAGLDHLWTWNNTGWSTSNVHAYQLQFNFGAPFQIATRNQPVSPENYSRYIGVYGQDSWTIGRRLTLNLGLRLDHESAWAPEQCRVAAKFAPQQCWDEIRLVTFTSPAPRAHAAFDVTGDGRTVLKGGYGRFNAFRELVDVLLVNQNIASVTTWTWRDLNANRDYDPGEVNLDPNGPDFRSISGTVLGVPNPNEEQPKTDELSVTLERQVAATMAVRATGVYTRNLNTFVLTEISRDGQYTIPITRPDPGPDGQVGTGDDTGRSITYYEYPAALGGADFARTMMTNDSSADQNYRTFELAFTKRMSQRWQAGASYTTTWIREPLTCGRGGLGLGVIVSRCLRNPNMEFNSANNNREWQTKLSGAYLLPFGFLASANYDIRSGAPQARQVQLTGGQTIRSIVLNAEPLGSFFLPNTHELDVRFAKQVNVGARSRLEFRADVYNALNKGTIRSWNLRSSSSYLRPATILFPRILQAGVTLTY